MEIKIPNNHGIMAMLALYGKKRLGSTVFTKETFP